MAAWVREHGPRDPVEFAGRIEINRNLPQSWRRSASGTADGSLLVPAASDQPSPFA